LRLLMEWIDYSHVSTLGSIEFEHFRTFNCRIGCLDRAA
jgi:hypothetical protein